VRGPPTARSALRMSIGATWLDQADCSLPRRLARLSAWDSKRLSAPGKTKKVILLYRRELEGKSSLGLPASSGVKRWLTCAPVSVVYP
jgi:hypothetical protein